MRTLVDLVDDQIQELDALAKAENRSRASLIRLAIDEYLAHRKTPPSEQAFGLWGNGKVDGLAYQKRLRREW